MNEINDGELCHMCDGAESLGCNPTCVEKRRASCLRIRTLEAEKRLLEARLDVEGCHSEEALASQNSVLAQRDALAVEVVSLGKALDAANFRKKALQEQLDAGTVSVESATLDRKITFTREQIGQIVHGLFRYARNRHAGNWSDPADVLVTAAENAHAQIVEVEERLAAVLEAVLDE